MTPKNGAHGDADRIFLIAMSKCDLPARYWGECNELRLTPHGKNQWPQTRMQKHSRERKKSDLG
jgi:hypothetical protein